MIGISKISTASAKKREMQRPLAALGAILTCPCHAVGLMFVMSGTALGAFLFRHITAIMLVLSGIFLLSCWLLWQTRDSRRAALACSTCMVEENKDVGRTAERDT